MLVNMDPAYVSARHETDLSVPTMILLPFPSASKKLFRAHKDKSEDACKNSGSLAKLR